MLTVSNRKNRVHSIMFGLSIGLLLVIIMAMQVSTLR